MGGSIFRRYRDRLRINNAHDVGKHWSFLAAESCNLIIGLKSVIPFLTKVKKPSTCVLAGHVVRSFVNPCWNFSQDMDET